MTEAEWQTSKDPRLRADFLFARATSRKLRLWACACGREVLQLYQHTQTGDVLDLFEAVAEGNRARAEQQRAISELQWAVEDEPAAGFSRAVAGIAHSQWIEMADGYEGHFALGLLHLAAAQAERACPAAQWEGPTDPPTDPQWRAVDAAARERQSALARDIFGNPFRQIILDQVCRTPTVVSLAKAAYDERQMPGGEMEPERLAVLADALEEAGAADELVAHLRAPGPHVRGCHVIDLCLGRS